jgi:Flp pilus assembly protein TadD
MSHNDVALRAYRSLLDVQPDDAEALKRAGQLMAWSQDARGARQALERFNRVKGGDYEVHYLLGELYAADRDEERARVEYERALRLLPARPR